MNKKSIFLLEVAPTGRILEFDPDTGRHRVVIDQLGSYPDGIAIDEIRQQLIYSTMGRVKEPDSLEFFQADGSINCINFDGTAPRQLVGNGVFVTGKQLVYDSDDDVVYWCDREGMRVLRYFMQSQRLEVLVQTGLFPRDARDYQRHCVGFALDKTHNHFYWTQKGAPKSGCGRILRAQWQPDDCQNPAARTDIVTVLDHLPEPIDLEIDQKQQRMYWTDRGRDEEGGNSLNCARITAAGLVDHQVLATGLQEGIGLCADFDAGKIYLTDLGGHLWLYDIQKGGSLQKLAQFGSLTGIALLKHH
ncbi:hypothetical protein PT286_01710 [Neisseriaceae bacterium ESL0693]|nr:hypothetical protein [Neisseriaceae bacterium ESL0693]